MCMVVNPRVCPFLRLMQVFMELVSCRFVLAGKGFFLMNRF